jgi:hypothetical protein
MLPRQVMCQRIMRCSIKLREPRSARRAAIPWRLQLRHDVETTSRRSCSHETRPPRPRPRRGGRRGRPHPAPAHGRATRGRGGRRADLAARRHVRAPHVVPPFGKVYDALSVAWWQYVLAQPDASNPLKDPTGAGCGTRQSGPVFFLVGALGSGQATRDECVVPARKFLFLPHEPVPGLRRARRRLRAAVLAHPPRRQPLQGPRGHVRPRGRGRVLSTARPAQARPAHHQLRRYGQLRRAGRALLAGHHLPPPRLAAQETLSGRAARVCEALR